MFHINTQSTKARTHSAHLLQGRFHNSILPEFRVKSGAAHAKTTCGRFLVPVAFCEHPLQEGSFTVEYERRVRWLSRSRRLSENSRKIRSFDSAPFGQDHRVFDTVL